MPSSDADGPRATLLRQAALEDRQGLTESAYTAAAREADLAYARLFWSEENPQADQVEFARSVRDAQAARAGALGAPQGGWAATAALSLTEVERATALGQGLHAWCSSQTVEEFNAKSQIDPSRLRLRAEMLRDLRFVARAMTHKNLSATIAALRAELAVFEAEKQLRSEDVATHYKDQHRVLVDLEERFAPGDVITNKVGTEMVFGYFGQPWEMTEAAALRHGRPDLVGRTVRYAYGKPVGGVVEHDLEAKPPKRKPMARKKVEKPKRARAETQGETRRGQPALPLRASKDDFWPLGHA
jgi:hypothetical protein